MSVPTKALTLGFLLSLAAGCSATNPEVEPATEETTAIQTGFDVDSEGASVGDDDLLIEVSELDEDEIADESWQTEPAPSEELAASDPPALEEANLGPDEDTAPALRIDTIRFASVGESAGHVEVSLTDPAAYVLEQTAPTEYVLRFPGTVVAERAKTVQLAPPDFPGIRSVRVKEADGAAEVRMFVEGDSTLVATPSGSQVIVKAQAPVAAPATSPDARAQLDDTKAEPEAPAAAEAPAVEIAEKPDDATARQNPTGLRSADGSKLYTGRLISLDLQETDIDNALRIIAEVSGLNIIASEDVRGKVTLRLIDVPWDQALDVILKTNGLDQVTEGNVIRIAPVDKLRAEREALLEAKQAAEALEDLQVRYVRISYARAIDLQEQVEAVLTERGAVAADERTNQLIIKDIAKGQETARALIDRLDLRTPQILLETQIVEAQKDLIRSLGFQWNYALNQGPQTGNATGMVFPNSIDIDGSIAGPDGATYASSFPATFEAAGVGSAITAVLDSADGSRLLSARLSAFEQEGVARVISRPQVATVNNKEAEIKSVEKLRVRLPDSGTSIATGQGAAASGGGASAFEEIDVGITLRVTPQASPDFYVLLDIEAKSSTLGTREVDSIPSTVEREATSTVLVQDGQTFALGGVYRIEDQDVVDGIPFLKDIPVLGHLFRGSQLAKGDEELIFFITPHIVEGSFDVGAKN